VEIQRRSDLTLLSQFIPTLIFSGIAGAIRCNKDGKPDNKGGFFKGVEFRCIGSVEDQINSLSIFPLENGEYSVHFGNKYIEKPGIDVYTGDTFSLYQLAQFASKIFEKNGFKTVVKSKDGKSIDLDPRELRGAVADGKKLEHDLEHRIKCEVRVKGVDAAIEKAIELQRSFYQRFGLEVESYKIGKKYGNFYIMREDTFDTYFSKDTSPKKGLVMLTATLVCRRCRRELQDFRDMAKSFPDVTFALVNLSSPQFKFYEKVFGDMSGGDVDNFRKTATGVTPFVIIYTPDGAGVLTYREYLSTSKADSPPDRDLTFSTLKKYFSQC
jgi:hypothetical protein